MSSVFNSSMFIRTTPDLVSGSYTELLLSLRSHNVRVALGRIAMFESLNIYRVYGGKIIILPPHSHAPIDDSRYNKPHAFDRRDLPHERNTSSIPEAGFDKIKKYRPSSPSGCSASYNTTGMYTCTRLR